MEVLHPLHIEKVQQSRLPETNLQDLPFGTVVSDHMFQCSYADGAWQRPKLLPFQNLSLSPATLVLHYGQSVFEGMKAFRMQDGRISIFRIEKHHARLNRTLERMAMPPIPFSLFRTALQQLVRLDSAWVPDAEGSAFYIRPLVFASEARFGVGVSNRYEFIVFGGPVARVFPRPLKVLVERQYIRAAQGGTGYAKCAGNYAGVLYPTQLALKQGFDQVIWTDASEHRYVEESSIMNLLFVMDGTLITPPLSDTILDGVTRDSLLVLAKDMGIPVLERRIGIQEITEGINTGKVTEAFGAGTAAVVAPIEGISVDGQLYTLPPVGEHSLHVRLKKALEAIRCGKKEDPYGWNFILEE